MKTATRRPDRIAALLLLLAVPLLLLVSCEDLALLMDSIDDEVKIANDRYLQVESVYPNQNSWFVNPGQDIQITFDKAVNPVEAKDHIQIVDTLGNLFTLADDDVEFDRTTNTLTLKPDPYLEDSRQYSVILDTMLASTDANPLRDEFSWSFTTGTYPKGYFVIHDTVSQTGSSPGYTRTATVPLEVTTSNAVDYFIDDADPGVTNDAGRSGLSWNTLTGDVDDLNTGYGYPELDGLNGFTFTLSSSPEGLRYIYMMFRDSGGTGVVNYTPMEIGKTFLDLTNPVADAGSNIGPVRTGFSRTATASDPGYPGTGSGIDTTSYSWSAPGMTVTNSNTQTATFTGASSTDTTYTATVTVSDKSGRQDTDSFTIDWDTVAPVKPTINYITETTDSTPYLSWSPSVSADRISSYRRQIDDGTTYTTSLTYYTVSSKAPMSDGQHKLEVAQYDDAGNLSGYDVDYFIVNAAQISPYNTETKVSSPVVLDWRYHGSLTTYSYVLWRDNGTFRPTKISEGSTGTTHQSGSISLSTKTTYYWYYTVSSKAGNITYGPFYFST